ncbi:MAG: hypothetical protein A3F31_02765 [Candidatus Levybacteria bacterium RIFCSPHIGHO2_12_FULL_38_12]|nr:MAG: hypothetical protein A2770_00985 [Candidatus Levybacteria bacterium RIFCSPHIGHO2_01_FULL_38_12]OGH22318.1 MAG: hypothetical protein A3D75_02000 [Candidatus Levybacteria bacterium RIFCSPHIGHO2_02_FULL_37_18]OGH22480.1 MAG: hypothetical protein A3F31_02765 [Candidatus Levybacteria bacterium RIFCSPHIGHO2_12_FULL_38_12]OGH33775.1 MAG: hypothetical protein A3A47_01240 [Candidatus Levybacteria bacterium RIFCSPLOWO2_01_FULL_37_20]OGH43475.1 MAG: hypothetical protein A3J14_01450 [Candidatus Lev
MDKKEEKKVFKTIEDLLKALEIEGTFELSFDNETLHVLLDTNDMGIVIGYHGEVLESLQLIASLAVSKKLGKFVRVSIEAGDYKKNRTDYLTNLALKTKERVLSEQREMSLSHLKSWERRIIHMLLVEDNEVVSESTGVGRDRALVIRPR